MVDEQPPNNHDPEPNEHPDAASSGMGEGQAKPTEQTPTTKESEHPKEKAYLTLWFERIKAMFQRQWNKTRLSEFKAVEDWTLAVALVGLVLAWGSARYKDRLGNQIAPPLRFCGYMDQNFVDNAARSPSGFPAVSTSNPAGDGPEGYAADYSGECENQ